MLPLPELVAPVLAVGLACLVFRVALLLVFAFAFCAPVAGVAAVSEVEVVPLAPDCWRAISSARRSTSAARAGSVLIVTPGESCAIAKTAIDMEATNKTEYIFIMVSPGISAGKKCLTTRNLTLQDCDSFINMSQPALMQTR
jgi:hypothetical protein